MKLKYKKIVLAVTMGAMCIGFVTISLTSPKGGKKMPDKNSTGNPEITGQTKQESNEEQESYNLECDAYPEVNELVEKYLAATITGNLDSLKSVVSDENQISEDMVQNKTKIIEKHENIKCYTIKVPEQDSYIAYVYSELKLSGIDTPAPGLTRLYIIKSEDGKYRVCLSKIDAKIQQFIEESKESTQVQALIDKVNKAFEEATGSDEKLKAFYQHMEGDTQQETQKPTGTPASNVSETPKPSEEAEGTATPDPAVMTTDLPPEDTEAANE